MESLWDISSMEDTLEDHYLGMMMMMTATPKTRTQFQPKSTHDNNKNNCTLMGTKIIHASCDLKALLQILCSIPNNDANNMILNEFQSSQTIQISFCDFIARHLSSSSVRSSSSVSLSNRVKNNDMNDNNSSSNIQIIPLLERIVHPKRLSSNSSNMIRKYKLFFQRHFRKIELILRQQQNHCNNEKVSTGIDEDDKNSNMGYIVQQHAINKKQNIKNKVSSSSSPPFILERSDVCCDANGRFHLFLRTFLYSIHDHEATATAINNNNDNINQTIETGEIAVTELIQNEVTQYLNEFFFQTLRHTAMMNTMMHHIAVTIVQEKIRQQLIQTYNNSIAFISDYSILPRKGGGKSYQQQYPMSSPPAVLFMAPRKSSTTTTTTKQEHQQHIDSINTSNNAGINTNDNGNSSSNSFNSSITCTTVTIDMGPWKEYLNFQNTSYEPMIHQNTSASCISITGLVIPSGITLIVGGGYHGKSTLLRCIACGVYNKIPGDGRELCVTNTKAVTIRAEDGRYVHNCNISGFISNLPIVCNNNNAVVDSMPIDEINVVKLQPDVSSSAAAGVATTTTVPIFDTKHFSSGEASGSTSQATNVIEAIEMGCTAFLVDEDVSAANFMARDGRMRSLIMDESITPLLYRVNGLYNSSHKISSIVVVGGVGDWLDVPHNVILLDKYICYDATMKAMSVSKQFSHGHVQYGGHGVVHRLEWEKSASPIPRKPITTITPDAKIRKTNCNDSAMFPNGKCWDVKSTAVGLLDGTDSIALDHTNYDNIDDDANVNASESESNNDPMNEEHDDVDRYDYDDDNSDDRYIDMSRCEQVVGDKPHLLYGCGICVAWILHMSRTKYPDYSVSQLLDELDTVLDNGGFLSLLVDTDGAFTDTWKALIESIGYCYRPRRFEIGQALTRLRGIRFETIQKHKDDIDLEERNIADAEERKKQELMSIWNSRRKANSMKHELEQEIQASKSHSGK